MNEAYRLIGDTTPGGILIEADHASARVPDDIDLGIDPALLNEHIAIDIGVGHIAELLVQRPGFAAFMGNVSRLVCDFNREEIGSGFAPGTSDGHGPGLVLRKAQLGIFAQRAGLLAYRPCDHGKASGTSLSGIPAGARRFTHDLQPPISDDARRLCAATRPTVAHVCCGAAASLA